jgi:hypothetical protein
MEELLTYLDATKVKYLANLVDWDTSGNQDDEFYLLLMRVADVLESEEDQ